NGEFWRFALKDMVLDRYGVGVTVKPYQRPHPPIALPAMSPYSGTMKIAGARGWIPVSSNLIPAWSAKSQWGKYVEGCAERGIQADPEIWRVGRTVLVTETDKEAQAYLKRPDHLFHYYYDHMYGLLGHGKILDSITPTKGFPLSEFTREVYQDDNLICGSPDTVVTKLLELREAVGHFGTLVIVGLEYQDRRIVRNSMRLLAEEVMPRLRAAIARQQAAQ
ncbi:MAG: LLM class flavin-dependent oxidoreductase, partial [Alphaproteobacteria bacterium]|nr:LLM class flavin-dependent oxidoreductase [Alphaproteobacteria bacterium]